MNQRFKKAFKLVLVILGLIFFLTNCGKDDFKETEVDQNLNFNKKLKVQINRDSKVSKSVINYLKEKTNNSFKIAYFKNTIFLVKDNNLAENTSFGTIDTSKEIVVVNETNTKHTFKVKTTAQDSNSITNIIIVEGAETTYEYFLKYTFDGVIPFNDEGTAVDFSKFNGTIETFNSSGDLTGSMNVEDGVVTSDGGQLSPCPDEPVDQSNSNDDSSNSNSSSSGSDSSSGIPGDDSGDSGYTSNTGNGGEFVDPDNDCGLSWSYSNCGCGMQYANGHAPSGNGCCGGSALVITDCNGTVIAQRNGNTTTTMFKGTGFDPCDDGDVGVILTEDELCDMDMGSFNAYYSAKSPFNVDLSTIRVSCNSITLPTDENKKFLCIYNKLTQLPAFKSLFINTFGESMEVNVTFKLEGLPDGMAGRNEASVGNVRNQVIVLNKNHFTGDKHPLTNAQTIIHECIHAYLKVKAFECSSGTTVEGLNNQELDELLNEFDYGCLSTAVNEHSLMFDILVPYMQQMLTDMKPELVAAENANPDINFYPPPTYELHLFSWDECLYYMTLAGLDAATAFDSEIIQNSYKKDLYDKYNSYINNSNLFNYETCNE